MRLTLESYRPKRRDRDSTQFFAKNNGKLALSYKAIHKQFGYSTATISKAIDHILYASPLDALSARVLDRGGSDHLPVIAVFELKK